MVDCWRGRHQTANSALFGVHWAVWYARREKDVAFCPTARSVGEAINTPNQTFEDKRAQATYQAHIGHPKTPRLRIHAFGSL
jgi:hypothetical protein